MSEFKPTAAQAAAIDSRGAAMLVSAGAGSGKTRVLTQRLMAYITDKDEPAELDSFLIITFTKAAAGELRARISRELAAALAKDPSNPRLRRQSALCPRARISTIHGFCAAFLRENAHLAGLAPDFKVGDEQRLRAMREAALRRVLEKRYEQGEKRPGFIALADSVGAGRDDSRLSTLVLDLYEKMQSHPRPERWAKAQAEALSSPAEDAGETPWGREILSRARESAEYWLGEMERLISLMAEDEKISRGYMDSFLQTAEALSELCRCLRLGWDRARACFPVAFPRLGRVSGGADAALQERLKAGRTACKKAMEGLAKSFSQGSEELLRELRLTAPAMEELLSLTLDFDRDYARSKSRAGLVDYADLEHISAKLLTDEEGRPTELARRAAAGFREIMVDEYQDVSRVQEAIFHALSRDGKNLFLVGDVKQSIYRFRLADPGIFTEKYLSWPDHSQARPGEARRVDLQENFRSRREVLAGANAVFSLCMSRALGDINYDRAAELKPGAQYPGEGAPPELLLLELPRGDDQEESPDKTALEAAMCAAKIKELVSSGMTVTVDGEERPLNYGDIAILLRSANTVGGVYRRELNRMDIPVSAGQSGGFFSAAEVSALISMLAVLDDPHQDIPLVALLRSPALGFSPDMLSQIRAADRDADLFTALEKRGEEDEKCRDFLRRFKALRELAPDLPAAELVWRLMEEFELLALCAAMRDGRRRRQRLMELLKLAESFEKSGSRGLHAFVRWLNRLARRGQEPALGAETGEAVRIMSVHRSKGLEFPVVFLCDTARRFNKQDSRDTVLVHPELGLGPKITDLERRVEYPSLARNAIKLRLERETLSEELRLLYVAMTRARERLYVSAALRDVPGLLERSAAALRRPMPPELLVQAQAPVNWLIYSALANKERDIKIKTVLPEAETVEPPAPATALAEDTSGLEQEIARGLAFSYPFPIAQELPSKLTSTELKGRLQEELDPEAMSIAPPRSAAFELPELSGEDRPLSAAERGTATHLALQYMDFQRAALPGGAAAELERLRAQGFLSPREAGAVELSAIEGFLRSDTGRRLLKAEEPRREFKFSLLCPAEELIPGGGEEKLLLQGVVDCFFEEQGELVILDYKTDFVPPGPALERRAADYAPQIRSYASALRRICKKPVKECLLCFISSGKTVKVRPE